MAKNRLVNTKFWTDNYVLNQLTPIDKLVFLYLITNPYTDISGAYELPLKVMAVETGLDKENLENVVLPRLERDGKIIYHNGWMGIKNFQKHQTVNPKVQKGMEEGMKKAPLEIRVFLENDEKNIEPASLSHSNSNSNSNLNTNTKRAAHAAGDGIEINEIIALFKDVNPSVQVLYGRKPQREAVKRLISSLGVEKLTQIIRFLPRSNSQKYAPTITTPLALEAKLGDLIAWSEKQKDTVKQANVAFV